MRHLHRNMERRDPVRALLIYGICLVTLSWLALIVADAIIEYDALVVRVSRAETVMRLAVAERDEIMRWAAMGAPTPEEGAMLAHIGFQQGK